MISKLYAAIEKFFDENIRCERKNAGPRNIDIAAKRRKNHKNKISRDVISIGYSEQKSTF